MMNRILFFFTLLLFTLNVVAGEFKALIPCDGHIDISKYPMLEKENTNAMVTNWLKTLDEYYQNPSIDPETFSKTVMMPDQMPTIRLMLEKWQTKNMVNHPLDGLTARLEEMNFNQTKELTLSLYPEWFKKVSTQFYDDIKKIVEKENVSYYDLNHYARLYSNYIDPYQYVGNFNMELGNYIKRMEIEGKSFVKEEFLIYYTERNAPNNKIVTNGFPFYVILPTFEGLGFKAMNKMSGVPVYYAGLIDEAMKVDGQIMDPGYFYFHDQSHISSLNEAMIKDVYKWTGEKSYNWNKYRSDITPAFYKNVVNHIKQTNETYGKFSKIVSDKEKYSSFERVLAEGYYFYATHESMMAHKLSTTNDLKRFFLQPDQYEKIDRNSFIRRINEQSDLGQAFKPEAKERTMEDLEKLLAKISTEL